MSCLLFTDDNGNQVTVLLDERAEVGRNSESYEVFVKTKSSVRGLGITDMTVSKRHACIYSEFGKVMLQDTGSMNGTRLNGVLLPGWKKHAASEAVEIKTDSDIVFGYNTKARIMLGEPTLTWEDISRSAGDAVSSPAINGPSDIPATPGPIPIPDTIKRPDFIRVIMEINNDCCSIDSRARDLSKRFDILKNHLSGEDLLEAAVTVERRINAELAPEEFLDEKHVEELRAFCREFIEAWLSKSQR